MIGRGAAAAALLALTACGPVSVEQAERQCLGRAHATTGPHGEVGVGVNSKGNALARLKLGVTSDYLMGRDPSAVFDQCVYQKSRQPPTQPLYSRSDWKN
ncbi:hypothetical protein EOK75_09360 [Pseudorhodobacter turbinis]|uniref:Lipoprotein n=1 Tax=Pseudorhodobacter turbinis TaxID=2500533 RepID=A0A4P8EHA0_9RHOB|nr:hypothetical protein [Pseudorhodobacter turbinis]QCO55925.1 hypothetical protein EOK75_09360 [Pseudorhodobacter turbinis]